MNLRISSQPKPHHDQHAKQKGRDQEKGYFHVQQSHASFSHVNRHRDDSEAVLQNNSERHTCEEKVTSVQSAVWVHVDEAVDAEDARL